MWKIQVLAFVCLAILALTSCSDEAGAPSSEAPRGDARVEAFFAPTALDGPIGVLEARERSAASGSELTVHGRVKDFVDGAAAFTLIDASLKACGEEGEDDCQTPWDYCCHDPTELAHASVMVELRSAGVPLPTSLNGVHGLDHLKPIVVRGAWSTDAHGNATLVASALDVP